MRNLHLCDTAMKKKSWKKISHEIHNVVECSIGKYIKEIQIEVESSKYTYDYIRASKKGSTQLSEKRTLEEMHHET